MTEHLQYRIRSMADETLVALIRCGVNTFPYEENDCARVNVAMFHK